MSNIQWIAFRLIIQYLDIICGQVLGMASKEFGEKMYWDTSKHLEMFYSQYEPNMDVEV